MIYRIRKHTRSYLRTIYDPNGKHHAKKITKTWYQASRKGRIFGFWHALGHEGYLDGGTIPYEADTLEDIENYIQAYHEVEYNDDKIEIIKDIDI